MNFNFEIWRVGHRLYLFLCFFSSIYAIGDCIQGPMLAHKAEDEGKKKWY